MNPNTTTATAKPGMRISLRHGIQCHFDLGDLTLRVWGSGWSGREKVWINDQLVSSRFSARFTTVHEFEHGGHAYRVLLHFVSMASSHARIEVFRNGELLASDEAHHDCVKIDPATGKPDWSAEICSLLSFMLAGAAFGGVLGYLAATLPWWLS